MRVHSVDQMGFKDVGRVYVCPNRGDCPQVATEFQTKVLTKKQQEEAKTAKRAAKRHKAKLAKQRVREVCDVPSGVLSTALFTSESVCRPKRHLRRTDRMCSQRMRQWRKIQVIRTTRSAVRRLRSGSCYPVFLPPTRANAHSRTHDAHDAHVCMLVTHSSSQCHSTAGSRWGEICRILARERAQRVDSSPFKRANVQSSIIHDDD